MTSVAQLLEKMNSLGILLTTVDGKIAVDVPSGSLTGELLAALTRHKSELEALAAFDWDATPGYFPSPALTRNGVRHKCGDCPGRDAWLHVWGERFCLRCWPLCDLAAVVHEDRPVPVLRDGCVPTGVPAPVDQQTTGERA